MTRLSPLILASLLVAGCKTSSPPEVVCPKSAGDPVPTCSMVDAEVLVEARIEAWANVSHVVDLEGFPDTVVTPVSLEITRVLKGPLSGTLSALFIGCISGDGSSIQGPLQTAAGKSEGLFYIVEAEGYAVVLHQGFFRREGSLFKNTGAASEGMTESELLGQSRCGPDAGF